MMMVAGGPILGNLQIGFGKKHGVNGVTMCNLWNTSVQRLFDEKDMIAYVNVN